MNKTLWIIQAILALAFLGAGTMKLFTPAAELAASMPWVETTGIFAARFAGFAEILGAIGLIAPAVTRIAPKLTGVAGAGLALVMLLAAGLHLSLGQFGMLVPNAILGGLAAFVAYGRLKVAPIAPRTAGASANAA